MKKRILSTLLAIVMAAGLVSGMTFHAHAEYCTEHTYVWDGKTWDIVDHWVVCSVCSEEGEGAWEPHSDGEDEDKRCDACGFNMGCPHNDTDSEYDDTEHWSACTACGQKNFSPVSHSFDVGFYYQGSDKHYPECDGCDYYKASAGEDHVDEDADECCDICVYWIHEHIYEEGYLNSDNGMHYPVCDLCGMPDRTRGEPCIDTDNDHYCDRCHTHLENLCADTDGDHACDVCHSEMWTLCVDADNNHVCDAEGCQHHMRELCYAENEGNWICDVCGRNFCEHYDMDEPVSNNDGTHTRLCNSCGDVTEDCYPYRYYDAESDETAHSAVCRCGYEIIQNEPHDFVWYSRSVTGHVLFCDGCGCEMQEEHTTRNGICEVCEMQVTAYDDVYVGGVGLKDGEYLSVSGNVSQAQPAGGYAYYSNGVLELNGYVYDGPGFRWVEYKSGEPDWAAVYAVDELILVLKGDNSLTITRLDAGENEKNYSDGIAAEQNLTIRGDGSLTVQVNDDGIQADHGDVVIEGGNLNFESDDHGFDVSGSVTITGGTVNVTSGDDGFNVYGDITITGGTVTVEAEDYGLDSDKGSVTITGGTVNVTSGDDGIDVYNDIIITDGTVSITAGEYGLDSNNGSVTITGGTVSITAKECDGIYAYDNVDITGGRITIDAGGWGISGVNITISGGFLTVLADYFGINANAIVISGGDTEVQGRAVAFTVAPTIADTFPDAEIWYGENREAADAAGMQPADGLAENYDQKYVRIETPNPLGDINDDKVVDAKDAALLSQHFAGYSVSFEEELADVDGDERVSRRDAMILARYAAEWGYTLPYRENR